MTTIAIFGHGEAGRAYAAGLHGAGAAVRAYDPYKSVEMPGITQATTIAEALDGVDLALSLVGGAASRDAAADALALAPAGLLYVDMNTSSPALKREIAEMARRAAVEMSDVAILAPVGRAGHRTALVASGAGAARTHAALSALGAPVTLIDGPAGESARLKLLRSVFMKGLATLVIEGVGAARAAGAEEWLRGQIAAELGPDGRLLVEHLIEGTYLHAVRREHEVRDVLTLLEESGQPAEMTRATLAWMKRIVAEADAEGD